MHEMLGKNETGKATFVRLFWRGAGCPNRQTRHGCVARPTDNLTQFPQIKPAFMHAEFQGDVETLMNIESVLDQEVKTSSGSELRHVAIVLAPGKPNVNGFVYLIDGPSSCVFLRRL